MKRTLALLVLFACSSTPPPCEVTLGSGADLTLVGTGSCGATLRFGLRVATGSPDAPVWNDAASAPVRVDGAWHTAGAGGAASAAA